MQTARPGDSLPDVAFARFHLQHDPRMKWLPTFPSCQALLLVRTRFNTVHCSALPRKPTWFLRDVCVAYNHNNRQLFTRHRLTGNDTWNDKTPPLPPRVLKMQRDARKQMQRIQQFLMAFLFRLITNLRMTTLSLYVASFKAIVVFLHTADQSLLTFLTCFRYFLYMFLHLCINY